VFRKSIIVIAAVIAVAVAALPSEASAKKGGKGFRTFARVAVIGSGLAVTSCYRYKWVETRTGLRRMLVNVCDIY